MVTEIGIGEIVFLLPTQRSRTFVNLKVAIDSHVKLRKGSFAVTFSTRDFLSPELAAQIPNL